MENSLNEILSEMFSGLEMSLETFSHLPNLILICIVLGLLWLSKKVYALFSNFDLDHQLVKADNKAVTIAFVGYLGGVVAILEGVINGNGTSLINDIINVVIWGIVGILLLNLAGKVNDKIILHRFNNCEALVEQKNIAAGVVIAGTYLGSGIIIRGIIIGEPLGWLLDISLTIVFFLLAQLTFYLYSLLYQVVTKYDFHQEIKDNNVAAGISLGCNFVAMGILLSTPLQISFSLIYYLTWFVVGSSILVFFRFVMDLIIIPLEKLDAEIHQDRNWGIAIMEGCFSIAAIMVIHTLFA